MNEIHTIADNWKRHRSRIMNSKLNEKRKHELEKISREVEMEDHIMSVSKLCATLNTNLDTVCQLQYSITSLSKCMYFITALNKFYIYFYVNIIHIIKGLESSGSQTNTFN